MTRHVRTVSLRRLARELRRLRDDRDLSQTAVIKGADVSRSTLLRAEAADVIPSIETLTALLDFFGVTEPHRAKLLGLLARARDGEPGWLTPLKGRIPPAYSEYILFEDEADLISWFEMYLIPGILQIPDYVAALVRAWLPNATQREIESRLEARAERQRAYFGRGAKVSVVLAEAALCCHVGGQHVMDSQLRQVADMSTEPNVTLRVLPFSAGAFGSLSAFEILDFPDADDPSLVYVETNATQELREEDDEIVGFRDLFERLSEMALDPDDSRRLVTDAVSAHGRR